MTKLPGIFRFEVACQLRRPWPWLSMAVLAVFALLATRVGIVPVTLPQDFILNSPFIITAVTVFSCQIWLLIAPIVAGEAAARDVYTGLHPLAYSSPITKTEYLGGRFLAALTINALILLGVQVGSLLAIYASGLSPEIIGPFRPGAYLAAYGYVALPNAVIATTFQFAAALLTGRPTASYVGSVALFFLSYPVTFALYLSGFGGRALLADPIGVMAIMNEMMSKWTIVEKNVRAFTLEGPMLLNRLLWLGVAVAALVFIYRRFRFEHRTAIDPVALLRSLRARVWRRLAWSSASIESGAVTMIAPTPAGIATTRATITVPRAQQSLDFTTHLHQLLAIARASVRMIATSFAGLFLLLGFPAFLVLVLVTESEHWGVPLLPRTGYIVAKHLTSPVTEALDYRVMIPLLIVYFAGELVWHERNARLNETIDATPSPEWVFLLGKFAGLGLVLAAYMVSVIVAGMISQIILGYHDFEIGRYIQILFGLQLPEYLLFAMLALIVHVAVNQKYVGMLAALVAYFLIIFASTLGVEHHLLVYTASPEWSFTDIRHFAGSVAPWAWFKLYWAAWALLLAVAARLLWVRGNEFGIATRLRMARRRFTRSTLGATVVAAGLILGLGGFIFYNTNVLNEYVTADELVQRRADYERQYGKYEGIPQPAPVSTNLRIAIYPARRTATISGSYRLVNHSAAPIDSIHVEPAFYVQTRVRFDRAFRQLVADRRLGHDIYALDQPLVPGDSLTLSFDVAFDPHGFRNSGASMAVVENGSHFTSGALPVIGYQPLRELWSAEDRRKHGLPRQVTLPPPADIDPNVAARPPATFDAIVATDSGQVAVAPGELRRTWTEGGRRYFHYASDVPIIGTDFFFSAAYAMHREQRNGVDIQLFVHPQHTKHVDRVLRSVRASLDYYSSQFGPYPYRFLQVVEQPGNFFGMGVDGSGLLTGGEGFFQLDPHGTGFDAIFEIVAHEMGHQWWGMQLKPAFAEGGGVISESLAWYSAMELVKSVEGREALRRFMKFMREPNPWPPIRTGLPLLRAMDPWANYRKGPYAFHALSEYVGEERVNEALRNLIQKHASSLATTLDMYRELQAVTPDSLRPLLHDLFEVNAIWTFDTKQVKAEQTESGSWRVTMDVDVHKVVADSAGRETEVPMTEPVEIGVFAPAAPGEILGKPLYLEKHRVRSGAQTITVVVPDRPARGGIDPYSLLDWDEVDNIEPIEIGGKMKR